MENWQREFHNEVTPRPIDRKARREAIARGQTPFAVVVGCSDSRVAPELLFERGLGELFVVRVAGNTVDRVATGTIEYGVAELGASLVVVLGHERCGAVTAAVKVVTEDVGLPGSIPDVVQPILPAVVRAQRLEGDLVANAIKENVQRTVRQVRGGEIVGKAIAAGKLDVVGAIYGLDDGLVRFL